jgi:hypothetical protein
MIAKAAALMRVKGSPRSSGDSRLDLAAPEIAVLEADQRLEVIGSSERRTRRPG